MSDDMIPSGGSEEYEMVRFPDGRSGYVPRGYGAASQQLANGMAGGQRGNNGGDMLGTFADGYQAVTTFMGTADMQRDLDEARDVVDELNACRETYTYYLNSGSQSVPASSKYSAAQIGNLWNRIQLLQDRRDYLQERILDSQIKVNYGSGMAAGARLAGKVLGGGGGGMGGELSTSDAVMVGAAGLGLYALLRDRDSDRSRRSTAPTRYA